MRLCRRFKGGTEKARVKARFAGVLFAVFGAFAAGAEEANAQVAQVWTGATGMINGGDVSNSATAFFSTALVLPSLLDDLYIRADEGCDNLNGLSTSASMDGLVNGLPTFGADNEPLEAGDILRMTDAGGVSPQLHLRIYERADGLAFAAACPDEDLRTAAELAENEFFLTDAWVRTSIAAEGQGYVAPPPNCGEGAELNGDICVCTDETHTLDAAQDPQICTPPAGGDNGGNTGGGDDSGGGDNGESVVRSKDERDFPVVGAIVMGLLIFGLSNGGEEVEFSYSPSFGYSVNESGYSANVGGRMDFVKDEWTLF